MVKVQSSGQIDCLGIRDASEPLCRIWERDEEQTNYHDNSSDSCDPDYDQVSSESSVCCDDAVQGVFDQSSGNSRFACFDFNQFLEASYNKAYEMFESQALARKHVVDVFNFNPRNRWHSMYLQN